ncbi:hypothetical protein P6F34_gp24 [Pseudomonas phage MiCath]|uniref:Uncharacterized protein n=1 Tax=Pseudomonas phage MiCath TaxID=3003729 RepID=A0AAF0AFW5_9CAUD|nr:hypothetical protein P6F34_gp24 [Pseudomonas phage MiCath]WAX22377.1 hypothetical protein [Pseudomonas phage MiCath]
MLVQRLIDMAGTIDRLRAIVRSYETYIAKLALKGVVSDYANQRLDEHREELEWLKRYHAKTRKRIHTVNRWMEFWE